MAQTLTWDHQNRLTSITGTGVNESYLYDADGQRVKKTSNGSAIYYPNQYYEQYGGTNIDKYYYFNGQPIALRRNGTLYYMHQDQIGNLALVTSGGAQVDAQGFYAYGRLRSGGIGVERSFTGQQKDTGTGLIYFNARYYDPELGTFISPDTIVPDAGNLFAYNRYMYVAGNPLRLTDSSGHVWETVVDVVSVGYGIYDIYQNGLNWENGTSLAVDVVSTAVPFVPAPGACVRWCDDVVQYGDDAAGWVGNKADDAWRWATGKGDEVADGAKSVDNIPCANSFSADTLVMTAGGAKPIAELVEGDIVLAYNEATGKVGPYPIVDTISHVDPTIVLLTIDGELIETTAEHPFYELESAPWLAVGQTEGRWTDALELKAGDRIWKADGTSGAVQASEIVTREQRMYNLTVAEAHTFFVGRGQWLVHNAGPCNVNFSTKKLQHEWKHAKDFGLSGNWNKANGELFQKTLSAFVDTAPQVTTGTFRKTINVTHHYDPSTNLWVAVDSAGNYVASWKLGAAQVADLLKNGNVQ